MTEPRYAVAHLLLRGLSTAPADSLEADTRHSGNDEVGIETEEVDEVLLG
jgi:hypothetical protein